MKKALNRGVNLALLLLGTFSMLMLFAETFQCSLSAFFPLAVILLCVFVWAAAYLPRGILVGLPAAALGVFLLLRYRLEELKAQFLDLIDKITGVFWEQSLHPGQSYPYQNQCADHTLLFLLLALFLSLWLVMALSSRGTRLHLSLIGCLPFFAVCIALNEHPPVAPVVGMLLFWILTAVGGNDYREDSSGFAAVLGCMLPVALLLALFLMLIKPDQYTFREPDIPVMDQLETLEQKAEKWVMDLADSEKITITLPHPAAFTERNAETETEQPSEQQAMAKKNMLWQNMEREIDLTKDVQTEDLDTVFLQVRSEREGKLYLRALSFGDYTGTGWKTAEENADLVSSLPFTAGAIRNAGGEEEKISVRLLLDSDYRFLPYFSEETSAYDSYVPSTSQERYTASYRTIDASEGMLVPNTSAEEEAYRTWAHSFYTRLPESTRSALLAVCDQAGLSPSSPDLVSQVAQYVQNIGTYDLQTEVYPSQDHALYFLTEARRGTCIHFATAACALYRTLGIPARITEGFLTDTKAGELTDVTAADAHAWVEVYQDGLGWLPVEVTGQSGLRPPEENIQSPPAAPSYAPEQGLPEEDLPGEVPPDPSAGTNTAERPEAQDLRPDRAGQEEVRSNAPSQYAPPSPTPSPDLPVGLISSPAGEEPDQKSILTNPFFLIFCALLLAAVIPARRAVILAIRSRKIERAEAGRAVIALYRTAQKAAQFGKEMPPELRQCAEKAAFSSHQITEEEASACRESLERMVEDTWQSLNLFRKFRFRWICALK